jgi:GntR family transcriptional regulator, carbon starvation induced regulator
VVKTSKTSETYRYLKADLLDGRFAPGAPLCIDAICKARGVSLGAVREALSRLTSDGIVHNIPQRGFVVAPVSADDLMDLTKVRADIECRCLDLAIQHGNLDWEGRILAAYHRLSKTPLRIDDARRPINPAWTAAHDDFHDSLIAACSSAWLLKLRDMMYLQAERYRRMAAPHVTGRLDLDAEHRTIMQAVLDRNRARACALLGRHLQKTAEIVLKSGVLNAQEAGQRTRKTARADTGASRARRRVRG